MAESLIERRMRERAEAAAKAQPDTLKAETEVSNAPVETEGVNELYNSEYTEQINYLIYQSEKVVDKIDKYQEELAEIDKVSELLAKYEPDPAETIFSSWRIARFKAKRRRLQNRIQKEKAKISVIGRKIKEEKIENGKKIDDLMEEYKLHEGKLKGYEKELAELEETIRIFENRGKEGETLDQIKKREELSSLNKTFGSKGKQKAMQKRKASLEKKILKEKGKLAEYTQEIEMLGKENEVLDEQLDKLDELKDRLGMPSKRQVERMVQVDKMIQRGVPTEKICAVPGLQAHVGKKVIEKYVNSSRPSAEVMAANKAEFDLATEIDGMIKGGATSDKVFAHPGVRISREKFDKIWVFGEKEKGLTDGEAIAKLSREATFNPNAYEPVAPGKEIAVITPQSQEMVALRQKMAEIKATEKAKPDVVDNTPIHDIDSSSMMPK